jgi:hypothetical protein
MIWLWAISIITPYIVSRAQPGERRFLYVGRLFLAIFVGYAFLNIAHYLNCYFSWKIYDKCSVAIEKGLNVYCKNPPDCGISYLFYAFLGWIFSGAYTAFWELLWQILHRKEIKKLGKNFKGKIISRIIIIFSIHVWIWFVLVLHEIYY